MKRKLFSVALCVFALLLLMGAGNEPGSSNALVIEEESASAAAETAQVLETGIQTGTEQGEEASAVQEQASQIEENAAPEQPAVDETLLVDGQPVPVETAKTLKDGITYVAMAPMVKAILPEASVTWDGASSTTTVETPELKLTAKVGEAYLVANGRYLYIPETVQLMDGRIVLPLRTLTKALDAQLSWDSPTGVVSVIRGSGAIVSGDSFYDQNTLFWMSRLITRESGNQPLEGMMAVGNVLMNRVNSPAFPNTIEAVLSQKNQFTTASGGKLSRWSPYERCIIAAKLVMDGGEVEDTKGALYFDSAVNSWASRNRTYVATLGGHRFFK